MMEVAAVARGIAHLRTDIGRGSSEESEWRALLHAAELAVALGADDVELLGDSRSVIAKASGANKCRDAVSQRHLATYHAAIASIPRVRLRYVPRSKNLAGIALAKTHPR